MIVENNSRGSALVMAIFVLVLLTALGLAILTLSQTEVEMSQADVRAKQAFYLAEASVEEGRMSLFATVGGGSFENALKAAAGGSKFNMKVDSLQVTFDADGNPTGLSGFGDDVPLQPLAGITAADGTGGWRAAFLTNDPTEIASRKDTNDRVMITGVGIAPDQSMEVVQAIVEHRFLTPAAPPAAITLLGASPTWSGGNSGAKLYTGNDCNGRGSGASVPVIGVIGSGAEADVAGAMGSKATTYRSGSYSGSDTVADLTDATNPLVTGGVDPTWTDCAALRDFIAGLRRRADVICTNAACTLPPPSPQRIVFAEGNFNADDGQGILVVTKMLQVRGNWSWDGMVLVVGTGEMRRAGGGNGTIMGAIVVADIAGADRVLFTDDDCSEGTDGFGDALMTTSGGGNSDLSFCQASLDAVQVALPYKVVDFVQR